MASLPSLAIQGLSGFHFYFLFSADLRCFRTEVMRNLSPAMQMPFKVAGFILGKSSRQASFQKHWELGTEIFFLQMKHFLETFGSRTQCYVLVIKQARGPDLSVPGFEGRA